MKTYVVNMKRDTEKRSRMEQQLKNFSLDVTFFEAIDGSQLSSDELKQWVNIEESKKRYGDYFTLPAIGCSLSHYRLYQTISSQNDDIVMILEDDAILAPGLESIIEEIAKNIDKNVPVAVLLTPGFAYYKKNKALFVEDSSVYNLSGGLMTSGYLINRSATQLLEKHLYPIRYVADQWNVFVSLGLKLFGVVPHIVSFPQGYGEIGSSILNAIQQKKNNRLRSFLGRRKANLLSFLYRLCGRAESKRIW